MTEKKILTKFGENFRQNSKKEIFNKSKKKNPLLPPLLMSVKKKHDDKVLDTK